MKKHDEIASPKWSAAFERQITENSEDGTWVVGDSVRKEGVPRAACVMVVD